MNYMATYDRIFIVARENQSFNGVFSTRWTGFSCITTNPVYGLFEFIYPAMIRIFIKLFSHIN